MKLTDVFCPCTWLFKNLTILFTKLLGETTILDDSCSVDSSPSQETETGSPPASTKASSLEKEEFQTPIKHKEEGSREILCHELKDHRYIIKSTPTPRVSGVNNSVSKYHPNQRVSLRSTPFNKRVEDEMTREEIVLKGIREKT